jgi:predicted glycosyltransferase
VSPAPRLVLYVQHLLGIGHIKRAEALATAFARDGFDVTVLLGGEPVNSVAFAGCSLVQLPPCRTADENFSALLDEAGQPVTEAWWAARREQLLAAFNARHPQVLLTEMFPFGRRPFRKELLPLLEHAKGAASPPLIVSSVRDLLVAKNKPGRDAQMADIARRYYDLVLVHGDEAVLPFSASFSEAASISDLIRHTGYVGSSSILAAPPGDGQDEIIVSIGGGSVGAELMALALDAAKLVGPARRWRLLAGPNLAEARFRQLQEAAPGHVMVERARPDFPALLPRAALSISQAGYNTVLDLMTAGCRALLVPFMTAGESEQMQRAKLLADRGLVRVISPTGLTAPALADAVEASLAAPPPPRHMLTMDGAYRSVALVRGRL